MVHKAMKGERMEDRIEKRIAKHAKCIEMDTKKLQRHNKSEERRMKKYKK